MVFVLRGVLEFDVKFEGSLRTVHLVAVKALNKAEEYHMVSDEFLKFASIFLLLFLFVGIGGHID